MADITNALRRLNESMKRAFIEVKVQNLFEDGTEFENFDFMSLNLNQISEDVLAKANLNTPLNIFKFMLIKLNPIMGNILAPAHFKKKLVSLRELKAKYLEFESKKIPMSEKEAKYVKSVYAALELGEIAIVAREEELEIETAFANNTSMLGFEAALANYTKSASRSEMKINVQKLKQICTDILDANNPICEGLVVFLHLVQNRMYQDYRTEIIRFTLCVMEEGMKRVRNVRTEQGLIPKNPWMKDLMLDSELMICQLKLSFLSKMFAISSAMHDIGPASCLVILKNDEKDGKTLMQIFDKYPGHEEMRNISLKIESFDQAKRVYELMLKLSKQIKTFENFKIGYDKERYEGVAHCYFAAYHTDPAEIYRLSELSLNLLEFVRKENKDELSSTDTGNDSPLIAVEINLRRMWNIKYDNYQRNKTQENLAELKKSASNRLVLGNILTFRIINVNSPYSCWLIYFDIAKCMFLVYNDQICARKMLQLTLMELMKEPDQIQIFNKGIKGIDLERRMSTEAFIRAVFKKFDPNVEIKEKNPFEDGTSFTDFVCSSYSTSSENILANRNLSSALNLYKFLAVKAFIAQNEGSKESKMKVFKECKKAYKDFMSQEISMTVEERRYVRSAYDTIRLAEMYCNSDPQKLKFEEFDFQKLKSVCCGILEGCVQVVPLMELSKMFFMFWVSDAREICRFLLCLMEEIQKKTRAIRKENEVIVNNCTCVFFTIREVEMTVNFVALMNLDQSFCMSSFYYTFNPTFTVPEYLTNQSGTAKMLMEMFENYEGEEEFQEIPNKAGNYDQAKVMFKLMMELANERKSSEKPNHIFDSYYFEGAAYSHLAAFVPDSAEVYKLCEKSVELLQKYLDFDKIKYQAVQLGKPDRIVGAMDRNYGKMERIKYEIYKKNKSMENYEALHEVAAKRIKWGNKFLTDFDNPDWAFAKFWTRLDLIKCHLQVKNDQTAARKCAQDLYTELLDESTDIQMFNDIAGFEFDHKMSKHKFVELVIQKYSN